LGYDGDVRALPRLRVLLDSGDPDTKGHAIGAIGNIVHKEVSPLLLAALERESDVRVRIALVSAFKALGKRAKERDAALRLIRIGTAADSQGSDVTYECLELAATGGGARPADFTVLLEEKHVRERPRLMRDVLQALASMGTAGSADALRRVAQQDVETAAVEAIKALRWVAGEGNRDAAEALSAVARSERADIAKRAIAFLGEIAYVPSKPTNVEGTEALTRSDFLEDKKPAEAESVTVEPTEKESPLPAILGVGGVVVAVVIAAWLLRRRLRRKA
jgi:HEAT repeat protein